MKHLFRELQKYVVLQHHSNVFFPFVKLRSVNSQGLVQPQAVVGNLEGLGNVIGWRPSLSKKDHCCAVEDNLHYWLITFVVTLLLLEPPRSKKFLRLLSKLKTARIR